MATVAEIGRLVGCSSATVSRAMNNSGSVSQETREAIFQALRQIQYPVQRTGRRGRPPNRHKGRESGLVELLYFRDTPIERISMDQGTMSVGPFGTWGSPETLSAENEISSSFYRRIIDSASAELSDWGYRTVLQTSTNLTSPESLADVNKPSRAGILLMGQYSAALGRFVDQCLHPLVLVDLIQPGRPDVVTTDNQAGITAAFDHLFSLGHRKIGFVGRNDPVVAFAERFVAYKWKMAEAGLVVNPSWIHEGPNRIDLTEEGVVRILSANDRPTAFVCANDCAALGVIRAASKLGVKMPQDISIVGFDDDEAASLVTPALTTVRTPVVEMGRQAVRQLMLQIQHPQMNRSRGCYVRLVPDLIIRNSTAPV